MMQLFVSDRGLVYIVTMKYRGEFHLALKMFAEDIFVTLAEFYSPEGSSIRDSGTPISSANILKANWNSPLYFIVTM